MTSLSCGVDALLRAAQYLQFLEEQESGQQQLYQSIVLENPPISISTGMCRLNSDNFLFSSFRCTFFPYLPTILLIPWEKKYFFKPHTKTERAPKNVKIKTVKYSAAAFTRKKLYYVCLCKRAIGFLT